MLKLYRAIVYLLTPLLPLWLRLRMARGKEDSGRIRERFGRAGFPRPQGELVWIHAASIGEAQSVIPLIEKLSQRREELNILVTTVTVTSAGMLESKLPQRAWHQFIPLDHPVYIRRFLKHWQPDFAIWVESEFWPNTIIQTRTSSCRMALVNGRMSDESYHVWQRFRSMITPILDCFSILLAQSEGDAQKLRNLGALNVQYLGNLKFDAAPLPADPRATGEILTKVGDRPLWMAASTHPGEEEQIAWVHLQLKEQYPEILTIIVPRHAGRGKSIAEKLSAMELKISLRSNDDEISADTDIYVADTTGELGIFYRISGIVFVGGSLVEHGGQNPLEAARLDCVVICGPHMENFTEICTELESEAACLRITDKKHLATTVEELLRDHDMQEALAQAALTVMKEKQGVLERIVTALEPYLNEILPVADAGKDNTGKTDKTVNTDNGNSSSDGKSANNNDKNLQESLVSSD